MRRLGLASLLLAAGLRAHPGGHAPPPAPADPLAPVRALTAAHRFDEARARLEEWVREHPRDPGAWVALGDVARVQGRWAQARGAAFQALATGGGLAARALAAAVGAGPLPARLAALEGALEAPGASLEEVAYARGTAAELAARLGRRDAARAHLEAGLAAAPRDRVLRAQAADLGPEPPTLRRLRVRLRAAQAGEDPAHARERARYLLEVAGDPEGALAAAQVNWAQREGEDARLLVCAALAAGRPEAADPVRAWRAGYGLDVRLDPWLEQLGADPSPQP